MKSKKTKRALVSSALALVLCFVMLLGTTFAWFTDNASTSVNKVQAGTLDVQLLDGSGNSLEGKTLSWQKAKDHENEAVLWEPGATYSLQPITIKNNGNLALKYKVVISGINGDAELNKVIDWSILTTGAIVPAEASTGTSTPTTSPSPVALTDGEYYLLAGESTTLTISGTMKTTAGNAYQGLSIENVAITVVATQYTYEYDSKDNQYDKNATKVIHYGDDVNNITLKSTVVDSDRVWNNLYEENGYGANGHHAIVFNQKDGESATFEDCIFLCDVGNVHSVEGGTLTFTDCTFYGWVHFGNPTGATISFENCTFTSTCDVKVGGGATSVKFKNCTFEAKDTIVDSATMAADYCYDGECGRIMLWSPAIFDGCMVDREIYEGKNADGSEGTATVTKPVVPVSSAEELATALDNAGNGGNQPARTIVLTADIDGTNWTAIAAGSNYPAVSIDGNGHTISNLAQPLFSALPGRDYTFENINFTNVKIDGTDEKKPLGVVIGEMMCNGGGVVTFENCHISGGSVSETKTGSTNDSSSTAYLGGFIGYAANGAQINFTDCSVANATLSGYKSTGGFIGHTRSSVTMTNCSVLGMTSVTCTEGRNGGGAKAGYFIGTIQATTSISGCSVAETATLSNSNAAPPLENGFVGRNVDGSLTLN